jgi:RHS repeat-associated protein
VLIADELCGQVWRASFRASGLGGVELLWEAGVCFWLAGVVGRYYERRQVPVSGSPWSTRITGDASGTLFDDIDYLPFGDIYNNYGSTASDIHYLFTGDENDSESSTNYAVNRNLSGSMARFNRPDPYDGSYDSSNPQSFNRYVYTANNPMTSIDPFGLDGEGSPCDGGGDSPSIKSDGARANAMGCLTIDPAPDNGLPISQPCSPEGQALSGNTPCMNIPTSPTDPQCPSGAICGTGDQLSSYPTFIVTIRGTVRSAPNNPPTVSHCLGQATSNGRGLALVTDVVGDIATGVAIANPASTAAILVGVAATSVGTLNTLANNPGWSALGITGSNQTVATTATFTHGLEIGNYIRTGTSFSKALTGFGILGSVVSTVSDATAAISAYTTCRAGR